jgi:hypothetical protein
MNYFGEGYAPDYLLNLLKRRASRKLEVTWWPQVEFENEQLHPDLRLSVARYAEWLPKLAKSMNVDAQYMRRIATLFFILDGRLVAKTWGEGNDEKIYSASKPCLWG